MDYISKAITKVKTELKGLEKLKATHTKNAKTMTSLKRAGVLHGKLNCNGSKYFWFIGKMTKGKRAREYVGNNKVKIAKYKKKIENGKKFKQLEKQNKELQAAIKKAYFKYN